MYVSVRDDIVLATGYASLAEGVQAYGLAALELAVPRDGTVHTLVDDGQGARIDLGGDAGVARLAAQIASTGVRPSAFCLPTNFNADDIDGEIAWIVRIVQASAELGVPAVRIDAVMHGERDLSLEERGRIFATGVRRVLEATDGLPVDLGIENHGFQGNDPDFIEGQMALVGSPRLGVTMDTGNFYWAGHPLSTVYDILGRVARYAKHTHVKNICYPVEMRETRRELGFEYERYVSPIPEGDIDHRRVVDLLRGAGYDRDLCIEDESLGKYDQADRRRNILAAADYLKSLI